MSEDPPQPLWIGSAEDQILRKLSWYRAGGQVSDRGDVIGILAVQSGRIDLEELRTTAAELGLSDLVERAIAEAATDGD